MNVVLDASAIVAFVRDEPGADVVESYFDHGAHELSVHAINLCEVFYDFMRAAGESSAESAVQDVKLLGVRERSEQRRVSLADCCALTRSRRSGSADADEIVPE
jgi:uncharacterized protein with PIN domain